jgi:uncharacterized repeat protein (TIGR01451 family)
MPHQGQFVLAALIFPAVLLGQTPSSTALTASPNPSNYGQSVILTATVTSGATGKVTFYDGVTILGVGTLSSGQASISTVMLASGNRKLRAYYQGDGTYAPSSSTSVPQTVIAGASLGLNPPVNYPATFTAFAFAVGDFNGDNKPDLAVADVSGEIVTVLLGNGDGTFRTGSINATSGTPVAIAVGDFNGDGRMDLAVANNFSGNVSILLGNGDGTFQTAVNYSVGGNASTLAAADFNGDGKADLVVSSAIANNLAILLGNGDGTFQAATSVTTGSTSSLAVADFNGDGIADLIMASEGSVILLLGKGDGTFQPGQTLSIGGVYANGVAAADFNVDGNADVLVESYSSIEVLLGNGGGGFAAPLSQNVGYNGYGPIIADFYGDGKPGVAFSYYNCSYSNGADHGCVTLLRGNGDGTFGAPASYLSANSEGGGVAVGDFNGDGKVDLVLSDTPTTGYTVLLGGAVPDLTISVSHGTGLTEGQQGAEYTITVTNAGDFSTVAPVGAVATLPIGFTAASLSGTGWTCTLSTLACTRADSLAAGASYPAIILKFNIAGSLTGNVTSTFTVGGGGETNTSNDSASDTTFLRYPTVTALVSSANPSVMGQAVTLSATVTAGATGRVDFYAGTAPLGSAPIASGQSVFATTQLPSGVSSLQAFYPGDSNYGPSASTTYSQTVTPVTDTGAKPYTSYPVGSNPSWIVAGDLNGDGKTDLVTANYGGSGGSISVLLGKGDGTFRAAVTYPIATNGDSALAVVIGDFNNDGKPDVAVVTNGGIFLFPGNGDGTFGAPQPVVLSNSYAYTGLVAADFNGDGNLDLVTINAGAVVLLAGNGDGTFQPGVTLTPSGSSYQTVLTADMNGDGKPDLLAFTDYNSSSVNVLLGNGDGTFQTAIATNVPNGGVTSFAVGDFNGDGKMDLVAVYWPSASVFLGNGDGTFKAPIQSSMGPAAGSFTIAGDFNGDGKLDIAYAGYYTGAITIAFGNGDGTLQLGPTLPTDAYNNTVALGEFNGDGIPDFAVANSGASTVDVFQGARISGLSIASTHEGRFIAGQGGTYSLTVTNSQFAGTSAAVTATDTLPAGLTAASISGQGWACTVSPLSCTRSDALTSGRSYPAITLTVNVSASLQPSVIENGVSVTTGSITGAAGDATTIVSPTTTTLTASPSPSALGQSVNLTATVSGGATGSVMFLSNGVPLGSALIVGSQAGIRTYMLPAGLLSLVASYSGDATHGLSVSAGTSYAVLPSQTSGFGPVATYTTGAGPVQIAAGDFNNDGNMDLVTANSTANAVSVLLGRGDGTFGAKTDYAAGTKPIAVLVSDFNNDGWPDIAVANSGSNNISILLGNGNGTFQPALNISVASAPSSLAASDFNGDGKVDLAVFSNNYSGGMAILLGNGDGTFQTGTNGNYSGAAGAVGDFNGDGKMDIVTTSNTILLGNGDGTFQSSSFSNRYTIAIAVGDLNGDGKLDVVTASDDEVYVSLGNGDGTFQPAASYPAPGAIFVLLADVNGDGNLDVITAGGAANSLNLLLGNGDGSLQPASIIAAGSTPQAVVAGDFNGAGRTDLAIVNGTGTSNLTVLPGILTPVLAISSSHTDPFALGQIGATYTITVKNDGPGVTSGLLTMTDTLPTGLTANAISGTGWTCTLATVSCTRSDPLGVGASYAAVTVTVTVSAATNGSLTNQVTAAGGGAVTANGFDPTTIVGAPITIQTSPAGLLFSLDGAIAQSAPRTLTLAAGSHTIAVTSPQAGSPGTQYVFTGWSDAGNASHTITVGAASATYTASFKTQYEFTAALNPLPGGSVTPQSATFYDSGTTFTLTAIPNPPYVFSLWSGGVTGSTNPVQVTMSAAVSVTATFDVPGFTCAITGDGAASIADVQRIVNEALGQMPPNDDLTHDGVVNVADVQKVIDAVLQLGCQY